MIDVRGPTGALFTGENPSVNIHIPCPGPHACPHQALQGSADAKDENEFYKDTGIRAGTKARQLLREFKDQHVELKWHGSGGIRRMWQHHTLEYLDGSESLRLDPSRMVWGMGWITALWGLLMLLAFMAAVLGGNGSFRADPLSYTAVGLYLPVSLFVMWLALEHMILPNMVAHRLLKAAEQRS